MVYLSVAVLLHRVVRDADTFLQRLKNTRGHFDQIFSHGLQAAGMLCPVTKDLRLNSSETLFHQQQQLLADLSHTLVDIDEEVLGSTFF
jgi:hypothetical protein